MELIGAATTPVAWNWVTFGQTVLATLIGATVALLGAWWLARIERRSRYEARLTDALVKVVNAASEIGGRVFEENRLTPLKVAGFDHSETPLTMALDASTMVARGENKKTMYAAIALTVLYTPATASGRILVLEELIRIIGYWRTGELNDRQTRDAFAAAISKVKADPLAMPHDDEAERSASERGPR
ncbi:hypothetical protein ACFVAJ_20975 [Agromyces sp. NPDC057679]|uniref:hypothetical protein n=1 Tax=Agromyces sp. NPDC057679 TaxID=3346207 RepID=UPI00366CD857